MKILVTGSAGHLGEALMRTLAASEHAPFGLDIKPSPYTHHVGSIVDRDFVRACVEDVDMILHTATLHKPHVGTHTRQAFIDTNISSTLNLLEEAAASGCQGFVYTSTTSAFGDAMQPKPGEGAVWVTERLADVPKNIYGVTKTAAENLCQLFHRNTGLPCIVLRTSRFFPEEDDNQSQRVAFADDNLKVNELLYRRVDIEDVVSAHLFAMAKAATVGFDRFIITATTPFRPTDAAALGVDLTSVLDQRIPHYLAEYTRRNWTMFKTLDRVYDNTRARQVLGWTPKYNFVHAIERLSNGQDYRSELARLIGAKGYHEERFAQGPYPVDGQ